MKTGILFILLVLATACGKQESFAKHVKSDLQAGCAIDDASDLICNRNILNGLAGFECWRLNCGDQRGKYLMISECIHEGFADVCLK